MFGFQISGHMNIDVIFRQNFLWKFLGSPMIKAPLKFFDFQNVFAVWERN